MLRLAAAFLRTRRLARRLTTRDDVARWQGQRLARWLARSVAKAGYYRSRSTASLCDLPVIDKSVLMANLDEFNLAGVSREQGWAILEGGRQRQGFVIGASTGTSGNRGLFVI